jgi:Lrp/AsnC family transcriptional regulator, leucine-responsive regulatory protein
MKLDEIDKKILDILQDDSRITNVQLSNNVGISPPAMLERVKRLEINGVIRKYVALVDAEKIGRGTFAFVSVSLAAHQLNSIDGFTKSIKKLDEVLECYHVAGEDDFILKVAVENIQIYEKFLLEKLAKIKGVNRVNTMFILSTVKFNTKIHID